MDWMREQRVGFAAHSIYDFERTLRLGASMVELKLEKLANRGEKLYFLDDGEFIPNEKNIRKVVALAKKSSAQVQLHLPVERCVDLGKETGINVAFLEHHDIAIKRFVFHEWLYRTYGIGRIVTVHPPAILYNGKRFISEEEAIANTKIFFDRLDQIRLKDGHRTLIGVENMTSVKHKSGNIGYKVRHFGGMLRDTVTIGLTIDTGHRLLTGYGDDDKVFHIKELFGTGIRPVNFHFHGNEGKFNFIDWGDDQHEFPTNDNVKGYKNFIRYFRRNRTPVVLEISNLHKRTDQEIIEFLDDFWRKLK